MATYRWHESDFISAVATRRGLQLAGNAGTGWRLSSPPCSPDVVSWTVELTPASGEVGPSITWRTTDLRAGSDDRRQLVVGRSSQPGTSFGDIEGGVAGAVMAGAAVALGSLFRRSRPEPPPPPPSVLGTGWSVLDPSGLLDASVAPAFTTLPVAWWGPGDERPAQLTRVWLNQYGLEVVATDWWCSAPALDQLIWLGLEVSRRIRTSWL